MRIIVLLVLLTGIAARAQGTFRISEFLASNRNGLRDADGSRPDWIEIENAGPVAASLDGWGLTDSGANPLKWTFPAVDLPPGGRIVVFASGEDRHDPGAPLHAGFSLSADGEYLALSAPDGTPVSEFAPFYPPQRPDVSYGSGAAVEVLTPIRPDSPARMAVPGGPAFGTAWRQRAFDDSAWTPVTAGIGYQVDVGAGNASAPAGWWPFEGDATDGIGDSDGGNNGAAFAGGTSPLTTGSQAAVFDGSESFVGVALDVSESAWTCSLWIRTTRPSVGIFCAVDQDLGGSHDRHLYLTNGNLAARVWNDETIATTGRNLADGNWHHIAHVFGGSTGGQRLYVDGQPAAQGSRAFSDFNWQQRLNIGFSHDAQQRFFEGAIDDVAVWNEALTPAQIAALAAGTTPRAFGGVGALVETSVRNAMDGVNASAALRIPFDLPRHAELADLVLRVHCDDGFVAWLNGSEVARLLAPATPAWNAAATADRPLADAVTPAAYDLSAFRHLLLPAGNVLAVQALNDDADSPDFLLRPELSGRIVGAESLRYFPDPTPGAPNGPGVAGFVDDVVFDPGRRYLDAPAAIRLTSATPGATIVYTTDGSLPSPDNGTAVPPPSPDDPPAATVTVDTTANLRAAAFLDDHQPSAAETHSYIFPADVARQPARPPGLPASWEGVAADYGMDPRVVNATLPGYSLDDALRSLPTIVLTGEPGAFFDPATGVYVHSGGRGLAWEREVSLEFFRPDGTSAFRANAGVRLHGNSSRNHSFTPKHPLRLYFRGRYGTSRLSEPLFPGDGPQEFNQLLLRGASTDSFPVVDGPPRWVNDKATYLRDQFVRDTLADLGNVSCRGIYVHLFLNGLYWGLYNLAERPVDSFNAIRRGGDEDDYDVMKDFAELESGSRAAWTATMAAAGAGLTTPAAFQKFLGNNPDGSRNPDYPVHLHLSSFIDYMIVHIAGGAEDWPDHNWWAARLRTPDSDGWYFFAWDQEISYDSLTRDRSYIFPAEPYESVRVGNSPAYLYDRLRRNPEFRQRFRDRVHELFFDGGPMTPENNRARWGRRAAEIDKAIVAESARWGDARDNPPIRRETKWLREQRWMQDPGGFWDGNHDVAIRRFRNVGLYPQIDAPVVSPDPGNVEPGTIVTLESPHTVYYTIDGSDPMNADGQPSPAARRYEAGFEPAVLVSAGSEWRYLVDRDGPGAGWTDPDFDDSAWPAGPAPLGYGDGDEATVVGYGPDIADRNVTTWFRRGFDGPTGAIAEATLRLLRDDGALVFLNGTEVARTNLPAGPIGPQSPATADVTGDEESTAFESLPVSAAALRPGPNVIAVEIHQVSPQSSDISFDAELTALVATTGAPPAVDGPMVVSARAFDGSEWSGLSVARYFTGAADGFEAWRNEWFPAGPPDDSAPGADPDRDGTANLLEYAFGTSPVDAGSPPVAVVPPSAAGGTTQLVVRRRASLPDVVLSLETSSDALAWSPAALPPGTVVPDGDGFVSESFDVVPVPPRLFLRIRAAMP